MDITAEIDSTLRTLADRAAVSLVAGAIARLVQSGGADAITVQVTAVEPARALPPAPDAPTRRGRPPKAAKPGVNAAAPAPQTGDIVRTCRECNHRGPVKPLDGRRVACRNCKFTWAMRAASVAKAPRSKMRRPNARPEPGVCIRCEHDHSAHVGENGKCLVPRCVCSEFRD